MNMRQLPLAVQLRASSVFAGFIAGPNQDAVHALKALEQSQASPAVFLYGPRGVGKTHLLQSVCVQASESARAASYLPLAELRHYGPALLNGSEHLSVLCIDDIGHIAADVEWNHALFNAYRELEERGGKLILADEQPPAAQPFVLRDLISRLMAGQVLRLQMLDESQQLAALRLHASRRGLELPDDALGFLLKRLPRDMATLCGFLDELDLASLAAQRRLTVPFIKQVLDAKGAFLA